MNNNPALLLIDVQKGFADPVWGTRNNPHAEENIARLLHLWRQSSRPVIHVKHDSTSTGSPLHPGLPGNDFVNETAPISGEAQFSKSVNSAFIGTSLERHLHEQGINQLVIAGLTTDHCVSTTTRMAGNLGFDVILVSDATATFNRRGPDGNHYSAEQMHNVQLASLDGEFCNVKTTAELLSAVCADR